MSRNKGRTADRTANTDPVVVIRKPDHRVIDFDKAPLKDKSDRQREDDIAKQSGRTEDEPDKRTRRLTFREPPAVVVSTPTHDPHTSAEQRSSSLQIEDEPNVEEHDDNADNNETVNFSKIIYGCCIHITAYFLCIVILVVTIVSGYFLSNR